MNIKISSCLYLACVTMLLTGGLAILFNHQGLAERFLILGFWLALISLPVYIAGIRKK